MNRCAGLMVFLAGCGSSGTEVAADAGGADARGADVSTFDVVDAPAVPEASTEAQAEAAALDTGSATCDAGTVCGGLCIDTSEDDQNCGRCGHDCGQGGCSGGLCQPIVLATGQTEINYGLDLDLLAINSSTVFWTVGDTPAGNIMSCAKDGCSQLPTTVATGIDFPIGLVADDANVFFSTSDCDSTGACQVQWCPVGGCPMGMPSIFATTTPQGSFEAAYPEQLSIDATDSNVYWLTSGNVGSGVSFCPVGSACATPSTVVTDPGEFIDGFALSPLSLYFTTNSHAGVAGSVYQCALPGCGPGPTTIGSQLGAPTYVAVNATTIYWTDFGASPAANTGGIYSCPLSGCVGGMPTAIAKFTNPIAIAIDDSYVYWANEGTTAGKFVDGDIDYCPLAGCQASPEVLYPVQQPMSIAVDDKYLYYTAFLTGVVAKIAKP